MFFSQNFGERFQEREKRKNKKREKTTDCKVLEVTALIQDTENMISSPALKTLQKYESLLVVHRWLLLHWWN